MTLYEDFKWRGLVKDVSSPELEEKLDSARNEYLSALATLMVAEYEE